MTETNLPEVLPEALPAELIQVVQLPVIKNQLRAMKERVDQRTLDALSLACTEESLQAVKAERTAMNKEFAGFEERRKAVKAAIMKPYEDFEAVYKECVSDAYRTAADALSGKINDVESEMKQRCEDGLRAYFQELCGAHMLDWLTYERAGVRVDMASARAKTPAKLRKQLADFVIGVNDSVNMIAGMEDADEIMVEFRRSLNAAQAIGAVQENHRRKEEERASREAREAARTAQAEAERKVIQVQKSYLQPPVAVPAAQEKDPNEIIPECAFVLYDAPRRVIWRIRDILKEEGIGYE